ncbi:MAG: hypothetical protein NPIRA04_06000 [Nitrospirales bacterium]|nr:MAG: hypothetical protein NPIRA04_06000 [Nitrospirales bacterium]
MFSAPALAQDSRIALVIGNGSYKPSQLSDPPNDAELMAERLKALNFTVTLKKNLTQNKLKQLIRDFGKTLKKNKDAVGLFYYSGHGMQVDGRNYMIPIGASIDDESDVSIEGVEINDVLTRMTFAGNNMNFIILDACRDNPFEKSFKGAAKGLARMATPQGSLVAFATEPHKVARQGKGSYSLFTEALAQELLNPAVEVEKMLKNVRVEVHRITKGKQLPTTENKLLGDFFFNPAPIPKITNVEGKTSGPLGEFPHHYKFGEWRVGCDLPVYEHLKDDPFFFETYRQKGFSETGTLERIIIGQFHYVNVLYSFNQSSQGKGNRSRCRWIDKENIEYPSVVQAEWKPVYSFEHKVKKACITYKDLPPYGLFNQGDAYSERAMSWCLSNKDKYGSSKEEKVYNRFWFNYGISEKQSPGSANLPSRSQRIVDAIRSIPSNADESMRFFYSSLSYVLRADFLDHNQNFWEMVNVNQEDAKRMTTQEIIKLYQRIGWIDKNPE